MKLERIPELFGVTLVIMGALVFALWAGNKAGSGQAHLVFLIFGAIFVTFLLIKLRSSAWMLILIFWPLTGELAVVPGHLSLRDASILTVFGAFLIFKAFKIIRIKGTYGWFDCILLINLLYILSVYIRNPVGTESIGATKVGGRPYFDIIFTLLAFWVLGQVRMSASTARKLPFLLLIGNLGVGLLGFITYHFPRTVPLIAHFYTGVDTEQYNLTTSEVRTIDEQEMNRQQYLAAPASNGFSYLCARYVPTTLFNPLYVVRFLLAITAVLLCLKSGHRLTVPTMLASFFICLYFREGLLPVFRNGLVVTVILMLVVGSQGLVVDFPLTFQRSLSFLPGKWSHVAVADAEASTEWRRMMWRTVMSGDKYITSKVWGDGFGFTHQQLNQMKDSTDTQENFMISGDVHSGPISTIRFVGYVGLALFLVFMFSLSWYAATLIRRAQGTPFFFAALFVGVPPIYLPFSFIFIAGAYANDIVNSIMTFALLKLVDDSLRDYRKRHQNDKEERPAPRKLGPAHRQLVPLRSTLVVR